MRDIPALDTITVYRYISIKFDNTVPRKKNHKKLWKLAEAAWIWLHLQIGKNNTRPRKIKPRATMVESYRLAGFDWESKADKSLYVSFDMRVFKDGAYMQLGISKPREGAVDDILKLQSKLEEFSIKKINFPETLCIGNDYCIFAFVKSEEPLKNICSNILNNVVKQMEKADIWNDLSWDLEEKEIICNYSWGVVGLTRSLSKPVLFLRKFHTDGFEDASEFVNIILPRLMFFTRNIIDRYKQYISNRKVIEKAAKQLALLLKGRESGGKLNTMEDRIRKISSKEDKLVEETSRLDKQLIAMDGNMRQIKRVLQTSVINDGFDGHLLKIYNDNITLLVEQMTVDSNFFKTHNQEASLSLQTLQALVGVEQAKTERRLVLIIGILGATLAVIDGFSEELSLLHKGIIILTGLIGSLIVGSWDWLKNLKNYFRNKWK